MKLIFVIFWCTVNYIASDSGAWLKCGHNAKFTDRKEAVNFYNTMKKISMPDSLVPGMTGVTNVKFDSIISK
jgi:hypothetical protein